MPLMLIQFTEPLPVLQHLSLSSNLKHHGYQLRPSSWAWQGLGRFVLPVVCSSCAAEKIIWGEMANWNVSQTNWKQNELTTENKHIRSLFRYIMSLFRHNILLFRQYNNIILIILIYFEILYCSMTVWHYAQALSAELNLLRNWSISLTICGLSGLSHVYLVAALYIKPTIYVFFHFSWLCNLFTAHEPAQTACLQ